MLLYSPAQRIQRLSRLNAAVSSRTYASSSFSPKQAPRSSPVSSLLWFGNAILITHLFLTHVMTLRPTSGPSMLPTFQNHGDFALLSFLHQRGRWIKAGDIISFDNPVRGPQYRSIKRVIGMPGDFVLRGTPGTCDDSKQLVVQVPEGHVWVAGDNLEWSRDSRHFGPLPMALIRGKVLAIIGSRHAGGMWRWVAGNPYEDVRQDTQTRKGFCDAGMQGSKWAGENT